MAQANVTVVVPNVFRAATTPTFEPAANFTPPEVSTSDEPERKKGQWSRGTAMFVMRTCNCFNGLLLVGTAIAGFFLPSGGFEVEADNIVLSSYLVFLGILMCTLELNVGFVQSKLRQNFGALFSYSGRTIFLLFCASVSAALGTRATYGLMWAVAGLTGFNALWNMIVICRHKEFTSGEGLVGGADPYAQSKTLERAMIDFLVSRPQVAAAVVSTLSRHVVATMPPEAQVAVAHLAIAGQHLGNVAVKAGKEAAAVGAVVAAPMIAGGLASADRAARVAKAMAGRPLAEINTPEGLAAIGIATRDSIPEAPLPLNYTVGPSVQGGISGLARETRAGSGTGGAPVVVVHNAAHMTYANAGIGGGAGSMPQPVPVGAASLPSGSPPMGVVGLSQGIVEALNNPFLGPAPGLGGIADGSRARARTGTGTGAGLGIGLPPSGYSAPAGGGSPLQPGGHPGVAGSGAGGTAANPYRSREPSAVNAGRASPASLYAPGAAQPPPAAPSGGVANPYARPAAGYGASIGHRVPALPADAETSFGDGYGDENPFG